jgi:hypothetical protein
VLVFCLPLSNSYGAACSVSSGVTTPPTGSGDCQNEPQSYGVTVYSKYLCTAAPVAPTASSAYDLSNCVKTLDAGTAGEVVRVTSTSSGVNFTSTMTRPPNGVYTHGVMLLKNEFKIKQDLIFSSSVTADSDRSEGVHCVTTSDTGDEDDQKSLVCSDSDGATPGEFTAQLTSFDGGGFDATAGETFASGDVMAAYLLNTSSQLAGNATEIATSAKLLGVQTFAAPVLVTKDTSGFNMSFGVSTGSTLFIVAGSRISAGSGPFRVLMTPTNY